MNKNRAIILSALSEKDFMQQVIDLAREQGWLVFHPYDARRSAYGFPDLTLVKPPRVIFAELKRDRVNLKRAVTAPQRAWLGALDACIGVETYLWRPRDMDVITEILSIAYDIASLLSDTPLADAIERGIAKGLPQIERAS